MNNTYIYQTTGFKRNKPSSKATSIFEFHLFKRITLISALLYGLLVSIFPAKAQDIEKKDKITFSGYTDFYFASYSDSLGANELQKVATVSPRSNRFGINIAQFGVRYSNDKVRGNLILHYGDIAEATWDPDFPMLQVANVGFKLTEGWWVDAGFFTTHIGTEGFLPKDNFTSTTAVATYNEPFYQSGARLSYEGSDKVSFQLWALSGYNFFLDANDAKSVGVYFSYMPKENLSFTYTNLFGRESSDGQQPKQFRTYHNAYVNYNPTEKLYFILGGDLGTQSNSSLEDSSDGALMYNALFTTRYQFTEKYSVTGRVEVFNDEDGFISGTYTTTSGIQEGLQLTGYTLSTEYKPTASSYIRVEGRYIRTVDELEIFYDGNFTNNRLEGMVTMGFYFNQ